MLYCTPKLYHESRIFLRKLNAKEIELQKLYDLLNKINKATLAADYELRWQLKDAKKKVIQKIKSLESNPANNQPSMVEYNND
jgi:hypothetical protein